MERINQAGQPAAREKEIGMKELQVFKKGCVYALVDNEGNYSANREGETGDVFTNFPHDGSWEPVEFKDLPDWFREQLGEFQISELKKEG